MTEKFDSFIQKILKEMPVINLQNKEVIGDGKPLKQLTVEDVSENIVFIRNDSDNSFFPKGYSLIYFMDSAESAQKMKNGEIPYKMVPRGSFYSGGNPITDVWKKKFNLNGHQHILGLIEANVMPDLIYIDMMSVRPQYKRNSITTKMIGYIQSQYPDAKLEFSSPTDQGSKFIKSYKK